MTMNLVRKIINVLRERTGFRERAGVLDLVIPLVCKELRAHWLGYATALVFMA
jgi:hypothetical protein